MKREALVPTAPQRDSGTPSLVTILFADVVASTARIAGADAEDARDLLDDALGRMRLRIHEFGGTLARVQGDGVMAIFGAPTPLEDHALRACCAADAICGEFRTKQRAGALQVRVGVHSGTVLTRLQRNDYGIDYDAIGADVHVAAKVEAEARPNTAVITADTLALAGPSAITAVCGTFGLGASRQLVLHELKSVALGHNIDRLFGHGSLTPFVGREDVIGKLVEKVAILAGGQGTVTAIVADAGMGKSRLLYELSRTAAASGVRVVELHGVSIQRRTPFAPLRPFASCLLGCPDDASPDGIATAISNSSLPARMASGVRELFNLTAGDGDWQSLEASARRRTMFDALVELTVGAAREQPVLVLVEDAHYLDWESASFLDRLRTLTDRRVGLIVTARNVARDRAMRIAEETIDLSPLPEANARELCAHAAAGSALSQAVIERVVMRASGNPLFLQEMVRSLRSAEGAEPATSDLTPLTVASLVQARLGQLGAAAKAVVQAAGILGDDIDPRVLALTAGVDEMELAPILAELAGRDLINTSDPRTIRFRHELFGDGARMSLLRSQATQLHARALEAIENIFPETSRFSERAAFHAERSGQIARALRHLRDASKRSVRSSSPQSVRAIYDWAMRFRDETALEARTTLIDIVLSSLEALQQAGELEEYERALRFAIAGSEAVGEPTKEAMARSYLAVLEWMRARHAEAREHAEIGLKIARSAGSLPLRAVAQFALAIAHHGLGDLQRAIALHLELANLLDGSHDSKRLGSMSLPSVRSRAFLAWFMADAGDFSTAQDQVDAAEGVLTQIAQPYSRIMLNAAKGVLALRQSRPADALRPLEEARDICFAEGLYAMEPAATGWLASALSLTGSAEQGREVAQISINRKLYLHGGRYTWVYIHQGLAEAEYACGDVERALETIATAVAIAEVSNEPIHIAQARYARGLMLTEAQQSELPSPHADLNTALELADRHGLKPLAAHCHRALARLARREEDDATARQHADRAAVLFRKLGIVSFAEELEAWH